MLTSKKHYKEVITLMDIIPAVRNFMSEIFLAAERFMDDPAEFCELEDRLSDIGNRTLAQIMGQILEEADHFLQDEPGRGKKYTIERHVPKTLITTYAELLHATLAGSLVKKELAIRARLWL